MANSSKRHIALVFLGVLIFLAMALASHKRLPRDGDWGAFYIAGSLIEYGVFTNSTGAQGDRNAVPGYSSAPGYPVFVATIGWLVPSAATELRCYGQKRWKCPENTIANMIVGVQICAALITLFLVFMMARQLSSSNEIAVLTLLLFLFTGRTTQFTQLLQPYVITTALVIASGYFLILTYDRRSGLYAGLSGFFAGLAALFYPPLALVPLFTIPALFFTMRNRPGGGLLPAAALLAGVIVVLAPWGLRNYAQFGDLALTGGRTNQLLAERVAFNDMSVSEWTAAFFVWLPGFGDGIARSLFPPEVMDRFTYGHKSALIGEAGNILAKTNVPGHPAGQFAQIVNEYIFKDFFAYAATLPPLFLRGFWGAGSLIGLFGVFFLWLLLGRLRSSGDYRPFTLAFSALAGCVLAQAMATRNPHFLNEQILFIHAYAIAHVTGGLELPRILRVVE